MKFFHLSDLHIGLRLNGRDLREDQEHILDEILSLAREEKPDAVCIAGDVYDWRNPSADAMRLFDRFVTRLRNELPDTHVLIISGNHDNSEQVGMFHEILEAQNLHVAGAPPEAPEDRIRKVTLEDDYGEVDFYLLPYLQPGQVRQIVGADENGRSRSYEDSLRILVEREDIDPARRSVILSHQFYIPAGSDPRTADRMENETLIVGNIDAAGIDVLRPFDYAALGHLHKPGRVGGDETRRYCGTPLACSLSEEGQQKAVVVVEMKDKGDISTRLLPLHPLRQVRRVRGILRDILESPESDDYIQVVLSETPAAGARDVLDQLRDHFPNLLGVESEIVFAAPAKQPAGEAARRMEPLEICRQFMPDLTQEHLELLKSVIEQVQEEEKCDR